MKKTAVFAAASMLSAAGWALFWPSPPADHSPVAAAPPAVPVNAAPALSSGKLQELLDAVEKAPDGASRLEACRRLSGIPVADIPAALEKTPPVGHRLMTLGEKVLLIHWAENDSPAAMQWAWLHYRRPPERLGGNSFLHDSTWPEAFRQIAPVWAYHDPQQFGNWVLSRIPEAVPERLGHPSAEQIQTSEEPILSLTNSPEEMTVKYVIRYSPRLAFQIRLKWHVSGSNDEEFAKYLETAAQVKDALLAFDYPGAIPQEQYGRDSLRPPLLQRWKELDPEHFARSLHEKPAQEILSWDDRLDVWAELSPPERRESVDRLIEEEKDQSRELSLNAIAARWVSIDPEAFLGWVETLPEKDAIALQSDCVSTIAVSDPVRALEWGGNLPPVQRQKLIATVCNSWAYKHPGQQPDFTDWSEDEQQAWEDLAAVRALAKKR